MKIEQYVMAYGAEQDRLRALMPDGFVSLRPVLRFNAELRDGRAYLELNLAVEGRGVRGWVNAAHWSEADSELSFERRGRTAVFTISLVTLSFTPVGVRGGCPAERDNGGCFFLGERTELRPPEVITAEKEFCDCEFEWLFEGGARGVSIGKTLPAIPTEPRVSYERLPLTARNVGAIPCLGVLGAYKVEFERAE